MFTHATFTTTLIAASVLAGSAAAAEPLALGAAAPLGDVGMRNIDGKQLSLTDVRGDRGTMVIFTCNHCPYVKAWDARLAAIGNEYLSKGVGVIAINPNDPKKFDEDRFEVMVERSKALGHRFPYVVDSGSKLAKAFGATRTPEIFLFDAGGKLVYHGAIDDNYADAKGVTKRFLRDALDAVVAGKKVSVPVTKALGCSIKMQS